MDRASVAVLLVLVLIFAGWFYGPWQTLCVDWARERMFEARNEIFDMAADRRLSFASPAYRQIRLRIESAIRFSHRTSWPTLVLLAIGWRKVSIPKFPPMQELLNALPDDATRRDVRRQVDTVAWTLMRMIVYRSMILLVLYVIAWILWQCGTPIYRRCKSFAEWLVEAIQDDALVMDERRLVRMRAHRPVSQ
jgi:hypothetical protein